VCRSRQLDVAGTVYAAGRTTVTSKSNGILALVKYTANGTLDTSFGDPSASGSGSTGYALLDLYGASFRYLGAREADMAEVELDVRRWACSGVHIDVPEDRLHLIGATDRPLPSLNAETNRQKRRQ
jgi:hypothetical protein